MPTEWRSPSPQPYSRTQLVSTSPHPTCSLTRIINDTLNAANADQMVPKRWPWRGCPLPPTKTPDPPPECGNIWKRAGTCCRWALRGVWVSRMASIGQSGHERHGRAVRQNTYLVLPKCQLMGHPHTRGHLRAWDLCFGSGQKPWD